MSLKLSKNNTPTYQYYSTGDGSDPVSISTTLDNSGGTITSSTVTAYLVATTFKYTGISVTVINEQSGIDWKLSLNNSTWLDTVTPADLNALSADATSALYIRGVVNNNGTVNTGIYTTPDIQITSTENPV